MGEASRKRKMAEQMKAQLQAVDREALAKAMKLVVHAITDFHGVDCLLYAKIGAGLLTKLGVPAQAAAGSAVWRVGPGDSDLITHAPELGGAMFVPASAQGQAGMFHAWIEVGDLVIDFTTHSLVDKARMLDEADGGTTQVDWCPPSLWLDKSEMLTMQEVRDHRDAGVCTYVRKEAVEKVVLGGMDEAKLETAVLAALQAYRSVVAGHEVQVIGLGEDGTQTEPAPVALQRMRF
jgi:hypothetical protein